VSRIRRALAGPGCTAWLAAALLELLVRTAEGAPLHRYEVRVDDSLERLAVHACFDGKAPDALVAEADGARFYLEAMRIGERLLQTDGDKVALAAAPDNVCIDYRIKLQPARSAVQTGGPETRRVGGNLLTSIGDWLWRPQAPEAGADLELHFRLPPEVAISAPWQRKEDDRNGPVFLAGATPHDWSGVVAFGHFSQRDVEVPGAVLHIALLDVPDSARQAQMENWIGRTARNVALLYGRFPVASLQVVVAPTPRGRGPVPWAYVSRGGGPAVHLFVNPARPSGEFDDDWSLTHEMSHLFLPYVRPRDAWLFEGLPTYLQNVLMARGGAISLEQAWQRMRAGFRRGARMAPGLSLARASAGGVYGRIYPRVYWGGAALLLGADLELRRRSGGRQSLDTALERLARCCASPPRRWSAQEIVARLDEATGSTVFRDLVRIPSENAGFPDFETVLTRAGVSFDGTQVRFDASAPLAAERDALMSPAH
jgi:hypothetical protein